MPAFQEGRPRTRKDFGVSVQITMDHKRINAFADVTGVRQWIDVGVARAESPFDDPVAHGFLTLSLLAAAVGSAGVVPGDAKGAINYGLDNVRFIAPVPAGKRVTGSFKLTPVEDEGRKRRLSQLADVLVLG
jgi:acyl dehydratase